MPGKDVRHKLRQRAGTDRLSLGGVKILSEYLIDFKLKIKVFVKNPRGGLVRGNLLAIMHTLSATRP